MLLKYFSRIGARRIIIMCLGNVFLGMGISIFKLSGLGNDAFNGMLMALANRVHMTYANFFIVFGISLFAIEFIAGRKFIGIGTIVNTFLLGYIVTFFYDIWMKFVPAPTAFWQQIVIMGIGVVIDSFGISLYQTPDVGVSPYDSISLILAKRFPKIPYSVCRIFTDGLCALVCFTAGGLIGLGTLVATFGLGPFIQFFNVNFTEKILSKKGGTHSTEEISEKKD